MHRRALATRAATILATGGILVTLLGPGVAPVEAGGGGSISSASATLRLACTAGTGLPIDRCVEVTSDSPPGARTWSVTTPREVSAGGGTMSGNTEFSYTESWVGETLQSVTIRGHMSAAQTGGGTAEADANYRTGFAGPHGAVTISGSLTFLASGSAVVIGSGGAHLRYGCGPADSVEVEAEGAAGSGEPPAFAHTTPVSVNIPAGEDECDVSLSLSAGTGTNRPTTSDQAATADASLEITISFGTAGAPSPSAGTCSIAGQVSDTGGVDRAGNELRGVKVELLASIADGGPSLAEPVATDDAGQFCFQLPEGVPSGPATLRATLMDWTHTPALITTRHGTDPDPVFAERGILASDRGRDDLDVNFVPTTDRPWLADVATIHYEAERFVRWILDDLEIAPGLLGPFTIETGSSNGTSYRASERTVFIEAADTPFTDRAEATSECPENCEWHEIAHHFANAVGIAPTSTAVECEGRTPHGGWSNATTCDSVSEGFASALSTLGSVTIDASSGPGYGTTEYSTFTDMEVNDNKAWTTMVGATTTVHREDHAFSKLLWDLLDADSNESGEMAVDEADGANARDISLDDKVALGGKALVDLLVASQPATVAELYDALVASAAVPAAAKAPDPDFASSTFHELTPLQELFVLHGFFPVRDPNDPRYRLGDPVGRTDHVSNGAGGLVSRAHVEELPGSAIRLVNAGSGPATFAIDIASGGTTRHLTVVVAASSEKLVHVEVAPHWRHYLAPGSALPACAQSAPGGVTITVTGPGTPAASMDGCAYAQAVATTTTGYAMSYAATGAATTGGGSISPVLLVAVGGAAAAAVVIGLLLVRRRRST